MPAVASFTATQHTRLHACVCASGNIPNKKRGRQGPSYIAGDFAVDSLIGKQLITRQESRYRILYIQLPLPFFPAFSLHLALRCFPVSLPRFFYFTSSSPWISLHARSAPRFSLIAFSFFTSVHDSLTPKSSFIRLKFVSPLRLPFIPLFPSVLLPPHRLADLSLFTHGRPFFPPVFPFFYTRRFFFLLPTLRTLSHSERVRRGKEWWHA